MPSTTPKGFPYPLGSDRLMDGDDAIRNLATAVDTMVGVFAAGQVNINVTVIGNVAQTAVVFPVGRFTAPPMVVVCVNGNPINTVVGTTGVTAAGFNAVAVKMAGAIGNVVAQWIAIQQ